jgi:DNA-binding CsgD family transcriptional regulator
VLSSSELRTVRQMARGLSYAQAAEETGHSPSTIRTLLHTAYGRLGVPTIAQALALCAQAGWLDESVPHEGAAVEFADRRVTWAQRLYLEAFDQSLHAGDDLDEIARTRALRAAALGGLCKEAGTKLRPRELPADPLERLLADLVGSRHQRGAAASHGRP